MELPPVVDATMPEGFRYAYALLSVKDINEFTKAPIRRDEFDLLFASGLSSV